MKYLAIGPGAMGFFVFMGALYKLQETGKLDDLEEISGSSAGSLLGFLYLLTKRDLIKTFDFALDAPIKQSMKPSIKTLFKDYGLVPISRVRKILSDSCLKFTNKIDITFQELYEYMKILILWEYHTVFQNSHFNSSQIFFQISS